MTEAAFVPADSRVSVGFDRDKTPSLLLAPNQAAGDWRDPCIDQDGHGSRSIYVSRRLLDVGNGRWLESLRGQHVATKKGLDWCHLPAANF
jgi:hypothetical protein